MVDPGADQRRPCRDQREKPGRMVVFLPVLWAAVHLPDRGVGARAVTVMILAAGCKAPIDDLS